MTKRVVKRHMTRGALGVESGSKDRLKRRQMSRSLELILTPFYPRKRSGPSGTSFLDLPSKLRQYVYLETGLAQGALFHLNNPRPKRDDLDYHDDSLPTRPDWDIEDDCKGSLIANNLLLVSRTVSKEVSHLFYSGNRFRIHYTEDYGLHRLLNLSDKAFNSMTYLATLLNSCPAGYDIDGVCCSKNGHQCIRHRPCKHMHQKPLNNTSRRDQRVIAQWQQTEKRIAASIQPSHMSLYLICEVVNLQTAQKIAQPFFEMPSLKNCGIRLGRPIDQFDSHFRYQDLPKEIRLLRWMVARNAFALLLCPMRCTKSGQGCFCSRKHAAASTDCRYFHNPSAIFQVCRSTREESLRVFCSKSHFVIRPRRGFLSIADVTYNVPEVHLFLARTRDGLPYLQSLEIAFPPVLESYFDLQEEGLQAWIDALKLLETEAMLPNLTIKIHMFRTPGELFQLNRLTHIPGFEEKAFTLVNQVVGPTTRLQGLKDCFVLGMAL
ncbi:hypothetical protein EPUS_07465 [Endocarpon pusillum Z07020]|uniref:Uncharacterized protein n=1 Tax=Endocarpon pusillum (strain Z07020 / HMAS-L-300199) TaxID=1263415 RepID=U1HNP3_ENDPU|nr:uncharacterized protein EPUS_07465 [Endocarpon pusillum Z07020]ERF71995.1 hypothetical protein EPUS_07465 [Endocarpon pusillum Z07020]